MATMASPPEIHVSQDGKARNVSKANLALLNTLNMPRPKSVTVKVAGADMQMWLLGPAGFDHEEMAARLHGSWRSARGMEEDT